MLVVPCLVWAELNTECFLLLVPHLAKLVLSSSVRLMLLSRNRSSLSRSHRSVCFMCWCRAILHCLWCSLGSCMIVLLSFNRDIGLGTRNDALVFVLGSLDMESVANTLFTVVKTGGVTLLMQDLLFRVMVIHSSLSSFLLSSSGPANRQSLPKSSFSAYPPKSTVNL
jgi:hypothetical protein